MDNIQCFGMLILHVPGPFNFYALTGFDGVVKLCDRLTIYQNLPVSKNSFYDFTGFMRQITDKALKKYIIFLDRKRRGRVHLLLCGMAAASVIFHLVHDL